MRFNCWLSMLVLAATGLGPRDLRADQAIGPDNPLIEYGGLFFLNLNPAYATLNRFSDPVLANAGNLFKPENAVTTAGVTLRFQTDSPQVRCTFLEVLGLDYGDDFSVYQNGSLTDRLVGVDFTVDSTHPGQPVTFEIDCPSLSAVAFSGLRIDVSASMFPVPAWVRPRYAAFGDSITHGIGQGSWSDQTYPSILAQRKNWQCFNIAVAGSYVVPSFGAMLDSQPLDIATVLWGQNDWYTQNDLPLFRSQMDAFLSNLRLRHPTTAVYLITLITSTRTTPLINHGYTREDYRQAVRDLAATRVAAGDANLFVLEGEALTTEGDLGDHTHFSVSGAENFAKTLATAIHFHDSDGERTDFDHDGDVDQTDFGHFQVCLSGSGEAQNGYGCRDCRLDDDSDVDGSDLVIFLDCLGGSNRPPACP